MIDILISCFFLCWDVWDIVMDMYVDFDVLGDGDNYERCEKFILCDDDFFNIY